MCLDETRLAQVEGKECNVAQATDDPVMRTVANAWLTHVTPSHTLDRFRTLRSASATSPSTLSRVCCWDYPPTWDQGSSKMLLQQQKRIFLCIHIDPFTRASSNSLFGSSSSTEVRCGIELSPCSAACPSGTIYTSFQPDICAGRAPQRHLGGTSVGCVGLPSEFGFADRTTPLPG
ncbi:hypothetical protein THAOC_35297 [Thalassiosira oceanica]|uniref:Uncharacterized protein n=1 Tax=Thalassiosira oceanica TaxID=159749 RepID=K0R205_THAOC|nr:hypothetical protein THAOC_35297 [Thalassiosira oceanica]|eukprot:EJK46055.1 hypothetical protein THAOC_35297 [Thalassiosira oceanica]